MRYLLKGNVQKGAGRLRVTAQLVDTLNNETVWTDSYDEPLEDILLVQDKITQQVVSTLGEAIWQQAAYDLERKPMKDFSAYDFTLKGLDHLHRFSKTDNLKARELFNRSIDIDRSIFQSYIGLGWSWFLEWRFHWDPQPDAFENALKYAKLAEVVEPRNGEVYRLLARVTVQRREFDQALSLSEKAVKYNPNTADILATHALILNFVGQPNEAVRWAKKAIIINPRHPQWFSNVLAESYYWIGQYSEAVRILQSNARLWIRDRWLLAAAFVRLGELDKARSQIKAILRADPTFSLKRFREEQPYRRLDDMDRLASDLKSVGLAD